MWSFAYLLFCFKEPRIEVFFASALLCFKELRKGTEMVPALGFESALNEGQGRRIVESFCKREFRFFFEV